MSVDKAYAGALFQTVSHQSGGGASGQELLDKVDVQLGEMEAMLESSKALRTALIAPVVPENQRQEIVSALSKKAGFLPVVDRFLVMLAKKARFGVLSEVRKSYRKVRLEAEGGTMGELISADTLNPSDVESLAKSFTHKLGKKVAFEVSTDPQLLAGMKVTVAGVTYDGTLQSKITRMREKLAQI